MKIQKIPVHSNRMRNGEWNEFLSALVAMEVGESIFIEKCGASHRMVLSSTMTLLGKKFATKTCEKGVRIGRVT